jgi:bacterioferritin
LPPILLAAKSCRSKQRVSSNRKGEIVASKEADSHNGGKEKNKDHVTREQLIELLNEDLSREYQAIIAYVVYSQVIKGAAFMNIADQLAIHAKQELDHALTIARQIDYLGGTPTVVAKPVKMSEKNEDMLRFDLDNENETVRNYRERIRQCEALEEYALAEQIRELVIQEQDHQIDLATALGVDVPDAGRGKKN